MADLRNNTITKLEFVQAVANTVKMVFGVSARVGAIDIKLDNGKNTYVQVECGRKTCVNVSVDNYYQAFCDGDLSAIVVAAEQVKEDSEAREDTIKWLIQTALDYGQAKGMLMCRLVNTALNKQALGMVPSIPFHDLSITFYLNLDSKEKLTTGVTNNLLAEWGIGIDKLFWDALANMQEKSPVEVQSIFAVMEDIMGYSDDDMARNIKNVGAPTFYVLTNKDKCMGAAAILYPGVLESCAETMGGDYYLLPSSIHEFLLAPASGIGPDELRTLIRDINQTVVPLNEVLADHAYLYSVEEKKITIV